MRTNLSSRGALDNTKINDGNFHPKRHQELRKRSAPYESKVRHTELMTELSVLNAGLRHLTITRRALSYGNLRY